MTVSRLNRNWIQTLGTALILSSALCLPASAQPLTSAIFKASSNGIYNGISETGDNPSIGINIDAQLNANLTLGLQLETANPNQSRQRHSLSALYLGYDYPLSKNWLLSSALSYRHFIDAEIDWSYAEWLNQLAHRSGLSASIVYSGNYYRIGRAAHRLMVKQLKDLPSDFYWRAELAHTQIDSLLEYQDASLTLGKRFQRVNLELGYYWNSETIAPTRVGRIQSPKWLMTVAFLAF